MFPGGSSKSSKATVQQHSTLAYPHYLNFYDVPPQYEITLEDFESAAIDRIRVLSTIESSLARNREWQELKTDVDNACKKYLPLDFNYSAKSLDVDHQRRRDHLSHFVLRLAFCRSPDLRQRFIKAETTLFRFRFEEAAAKATKDLAAFLESQRFNWEKVPPNELQALRADVLAAHGNSKALTDKWPVAGPPPAFYRVDWTKAPDLVLNRKVYMRNKKVYVPEIEQLSIVMEDFTSRLEKALIQTAMALPRLDEDDRIMPVLEHLSESMISGIPSDNTFSLAEADGTTITADMINELAQKHFPMCMRNLHDNLRKARHLKHTGRLQYGLFLKGLGMELEEAILFWRKSFRGGPIQEDKFNKEYKYNIRHQYGQEGKRANYPPMNCQRIITSAPPGPQEAHGCPFKHFSLENLDTALMANYGGCGMTSGAIADINHYVKEKHFHLACTRVFEVTHGIPAGEGLGSKESVTHPNRYAARSRELAAPLAKAVKSEGVKAEDVTMTDA
ncbi:DNA primase, large subunit [Auricularia subglabra TFB-10046 SS5]|nr:DNA primase, large subunit [Auricularia subglabra TFB-10046 SS5]